MAFNRFIRIQIYNSDNSAVQYDNYVDGTWGITNLKLDKILMEKELAFGECNSSCFEVQVFGLDTDIELGGRAIKVYSLETVTDTEYWVDDSNNNITTEDGDLLVFSDGESIETTLLFAGWIDSSENDEIATDRNIVAYDWYYYHRRDNIATWWNTVWTPIGTSDRAYSLGNFRNMLMLEMGISYPSGETYSSSMDNVLLTNTFGATVESLEFEAVWKALAQISCQTYVMVDFTNVKPITLSTATPTDISDNIEKLNSSWKDFSTNAVSGISVYDTSSTLTQTYIPDGGTSDNLMKIVGNIFLLNRTSEELTEILEDMYDLVKDYTYVPASIKCIVSDVHYTLGQAITTSKGDTYIMQLHMSGTVLVEETLDAVAESKTLSDDISDMNSSLIEYGRYARVTKDIDAFKIEYGNYKQQVSTQFEQDESKIVLKADSNGNIGLAELSADPDDGLTYFRINADNLQFVANQSLDLSSADLSITSSHFSVDTSGNITATNVNLTGEINATSGQIGGLTIDSSGIALESEYVVIDPLHGLYLNPDPSTGEFTTTFNINGIYLGEYAEISVDNVGGYVDLTGETSTHEYNLTVQSDDIIKTTEITATGLTTGWGNTSYNSLDTLLSALANDNRVPLIEETTRTAHYCYGYISDNSTKLRISVPMKFAMDVPDGTAVRVTAVTASIRLASGGYVGGLGADADLQQYFTSGSVSQLQDCMKLTFTGGNWGTNNTPVTGIISLIFEVCNYKWHYNTDKTLVVREKISDGSFRWYFNNFDTTNAGRTGNTEYYVPSSLRKFVLFDYGNETPPVQIDGTWYYYNIMRGTNKASGGGITIGFEIRDGYTTPYIIAYHTEHIYKGPNNKAIIESTDFDGSAQYVPGGALSAIIRTSNHAWTAPTFDPING